MPEVIDVWFDSGAMPFAQRHAPFEGELSLDERFPADFICEALDQTRGWFYSLLAISTLLRGGETPYDHVVCLGLILDAEGQKMSKSKGNVVAPWEVIDRYGADALRWYFFTSKQPWDGYRFSPESIGEGVRLFLRQLWNTYALLDAVRSAEAALADAPQTDLDRWIRSRLSATVDDGHRAPGGLRRDDRRPRDRRVRRRSLQLVRAPLAAALLGGRPRRARRRCATAS